MDPNLAKVLVVDDEPVVLAVLKEQLQSEGFDVVTADSPSQAWETLQRSRFTVLLADQEMRGTSGLDLFSKIRASHPATIRVLLNSTLSLKELADAIKSEAIHRFITKPWLREDLLAVLKNSVASALSQTPLSIAAPDVAGPADAEAASPGAPEAAPAGVLNTSEGADGAVEVFTKMLGSFHPNLGNTALRAMALCSSLADVLKLPDDQANSLIWAAGLHDIALVGIERGIVRRWLRSPEKCTEEELSLIKRHPKEGEEMLQVWPIFKNAGEIIRGHHENWDGTGYPDRLKAESIPQLSRVLAAAVYYASRHSGHAQVMSEVQGLVDKMFDPKVVEAIAQAGPMTEMPRGEREILLIELQPGMVLARDIYNTAGVLIIAKGKELTAAWINKITNINSATPLNPHVLVYT